MAKGICVRPTVSERFWAKVDKHGPSPTYKPELGPCWLWTGAHDDLGYGQFRLSASKLVKAYRWLYEDRIGPFPEGLEPDHLCRVPACVKVVSDEHGPAHLEPVTHAVNVLRSADVRSATLRAKTHCRNGHPYDEVNTCWHKGWRICRTCRRDRQRQAYQKGGGNK